MTANQFYERHLDAIQVPKDAIKRAKDQREVVAKEALGLLETWGLTGRLWYPTGALAMGTQIHPLNDFDLVVEAAQIRPEWADRPQTVLDDLCDGLSERLGIPCETSTHAVRLDFGQYTADVVFGLTRSKGIFLPHCPDDEEHDWIDSHPRRHAQLVRDRNRDIGYEFARQVRIFKSLNRRWQMQDEERGKAVSSWHLTALALTVVTKRLSYTDALPFFFERAARLVLQPLPDPSGVGADLEARDPERAARLFTHAAEVTREAARTGDAAEEILKPLFGDAVALHAALRGDAINVGVGGVLTVGIGRPVHTAVRSHGDDG